MRAERLLLALLFFALSCKKSQATPDPAADAGAGAPPPSASAADPSACGPLDCHLYDTPADAMRAILATKPLIVAVGESHALRGTEGIESSAKRFTDELLPVFQGRASDLLLELMMPAKGCEQKADQARTAQKPATESHAENDQSEYVAMGNAARPLGIIPDLLRPSCDDLAAIAKSKDDAISTTLSTIRRLAVAQTKALLARKDHDPEQAILLYGGALHNDPKPPAELRDWSYGPELASAVGQRYVAVDVFVPEFITDDPTWKRWEWYPYFDHAAHPDKVTVFHPRDEVYVLIFAATPQ